MRTTRGAAWRLLLVTALLAALIAACGGDDDPTPTPSPVAERTPLPNPTQTPAPEPTPTPTPEPTPEPTPTPVVIEPFPEVSDEPSASAIEVQRKLRQLTSAYGEPPWANLGRLRIPALAMDAPVAGYLVDDGGMPAPGNPVEVAWFDMRNYPGMGGTPGEGGNAIFSAHVDFNRVVDYAGVRFRDKAVFWDLETLQPGNLIELDFQGRLLQYRVRWVESFEAGYEKWGEIWSDDVRIDSLTLYTCTGDFDYGTRSYSHRVVVRAERVNL